MARRMKKKLKPNHKKGKVILWSIAILLLIVAAGFSYVYIRMYALSQNAVEIIEKPQTTATALPSETLAPIEGTPSDIDEDYDVEVTDPTQEPIYKQVTIDENVINILLVGSDVRPDQTGNGRSDTMMLLSYNRQQQDAALVSFMRDIWISIPNHSWNRINAAYSFGGIGLCMNTVNENFDLDNQYYIQVDFVGFSDIVDELGGIDVNLTSKEAAYINEHISGSNLLEKDGVQTLNGDQTLVQCRNRKMGDGDFGRTRRQREVMLSIFNKVKSERDPVKLSMLLSKALEHVKTNISPNMLFSIGLEVVGADDFDVKQSRIPFDHTWSYANEDGRSVISIDLKKNTQLLHELLYGKDDE